LIKAGLTGLNISLDTLNPDTFVEITRRPLFARVQAGLEKVMSLGLTNIKFNCVPIYEVNDAEIPALAALARDYPVKVRFIELMPIGCAYEVGYRGVPMDEVRERLEKAHGPLRPVGKKTDRLQGPAEYYKVAGFAGQVGFIDAMEHKFCSSCNRVRLTAEGFLKLCLNQKNGLDLRQLLRSGISDENLKLALRQAIYRKPAEHLFTDHFNTARDSRAMYQVGG
jgi:cyclic pyranopterin phosphate synthase